MKINSNGKKLNKKKIIVSCIIICLLILVVVLGILYENNSNVKVFLDKYAFFKEKYENNLQKILISSGDGLNVYAYNGSILILENNLLTIYNKNGNKDTTLDVEISNPIFASNGDYLCIAEKGGHRIYGIYNKNILWKKDLENNIYDVEINSNGYVAISLTGTIDKTIVQMLDDKGTELLNIFLSSTYVLDMDISQDNKYLAIAEANFSGILIQSNIKVISLEKAKNGDKDLITYSHLSQSGDLIVNIKYQNKNELSCIYDNHIDVIKDDEVTQISNFEQEEVLFTDLNNRIIKVINEESKIYLQITNTTSKNSKKYEISEPKEIYASDNIIALNLGTEVLFYNNMGWLVKKYSATQEINNIVLCDDLAGIVYNNKIELISL